MKKRVVSLFLLSFSLAVIAGTGGNTPDVPEVKNTGTTDTIPFDFDEDILSEISDSLGSAGIEDMVLSEDGVPSEDIYGTWDTLNIHPYRFDVNSITHTTFIPLCSENSCGYAHPIQGTVTSAFGPRKKRYHYGIDIDLETGDNVGAAFDGKVRIVKLSKSYGNVIVIRHNNGLETFYAHLSKVNVEVGQNVLAGDVIGLGGNTGRSSGSHLHFEVRYMGKPINPSDIISFDEQKLKTNALTLNKETFSYIEEAKKLAIKNKGKGRVYVVKKGDTLSKIARKYGTSVQALCKKNRIKKSAILRKGQKIKV